MKATVEKFFFDQYNLQPAVIVRSPGRVNIIGEHADYNNGFVLPAAIDKAAYLAVSLRNDNEIHLTALDLNETFSIIKLFSMLHPQLIAMNIFRTFPKFINNNN